MTKGPRDNEFSIKIANVNGAGSASANALLMKSLFRMGIPVVGKNYFPSNIQGLPTWYEIRVSGESHLARSGRVDVMVAMNAETYRQDLAEVRRTFVDPPEQPAYYNGEPAIVLSVILQQGVNAVQFGAELTDRLDRIEERLRGGQQ